MSAPGSRFNVTPSYPWFCSHRRNAFVNVLFPLPAVPIKYMCFAAISKLLVGVRERA